MAHAKGFALVVVLWGTALLTVMATSFAFSMRAETLLASNHVDQARAAVLAEAGVRRGILALMVSGNQPEARWRTDGSVYEVPFAEGLLRIAITAESGKIDLNRAPEALIRGLMSALGENFSADHLADAVLDWRDRDNVPRQNGTEDAGYAAAGRPYGARDGAFQTVEELYQVLGMTEEAVHRLASAVTVYSLHSRIDPRVAPRAALLAIPTVSPVQVDEFLAAREEAAREGSPIPVDLLSSGAPFIATLKTNVYTVEAEAVLPGEVTARRRAVVQRRRTGVKPYTILAWYAINDSARGSKPAVATEG
jgi:general secretion pathway protein K